MIINGGPDDETLTGTPGDDVIDGAGGADTMIGLAGNDVYYVDNVGDQVIEAAGGGSDTIYTSVDYTLVAGQEIERLRANSKSGVTLTGNELDNVLYGYLDGYDPFSDGATAADTLIGLGGNDTYYIDGGDRVIEAVGGGFDTVFVKAFSYVVPADAEIEVLYVSSDFIDPGVNVWLNDFGMTLNTPAGVLNELHGGAGDDVISAGDGHNFVYGGAGDDVITQTGVRSIIDGGTGADIMGGGGGRAIFNTFYVDNAGDQILGSESLASVYASIDWTLKGGLISGTLFAAGPVGLRLTSEVANVKLVGAAGDDTLSGGNVMDGGAGADTLIGGAADNTYYVDNAGDRVIEAPGGGNDTVHAYGDYTLGAGLEIETLRASGASSHSLTGNELANKLIGEQGNDTLAGGGGNDSLDGGRGADTMAGGSGDDTYYVDNASDQTIEAAGGGSDTVYTTVNFTLAAGQEVEYLRANKPSNNIVLTGNELANTLVGGQYHDTLNGGDGNDTLDGGVDSDTMAGGSGDDIYYVDSSYDQVIEAAGGGNDTVYVRGAFALGAGQEVETLRAYGGTAVNLTGNELANNLLGAAGEDSLFGGGGDDTIDGRGGGDGMAGGAGNDIYYVDNAGDFLFEAIGGGSDTAYISANFALNAGQEVEFLRVSGSAARTVTGNELANTLIGNAGRDTLNGGGGNDTLDGGLGADVMAGGSGNDSFYVDHAGDRVIEAVGGGSDTVHTTVSFTLGAGQEVEYLRVNGPLYAIVLTGNELANTLIGERRNDTLNGGGGNDTLDGGVGRDTMAGGSGDDVYYVDNYYDQVIEAVGGGNDTVYVRAGFTLAAGQEVETVRALGAAGLTLAGNERANAIYGSGGNDTLNGGGGNDTLDGRTGADRMAGGAGNDIYYVDNAGDRVTEAAGGGNDTIYTRVNLTLDGTQEIETLRVLGSAGLTLAGNFRDNHLIGGAGADTLEGGAGNDTLDGGAGADTMAGGAGDDVFYVDKAGDRVIEAVGGGNDTVYARASYTLAAGQEIEALRALGSVGLTLAGNERDNAIYGSGGNDTLNGGGGRDTLNGRAGADVMTGGSGDDLYYVDNTADRVIEAAGGGNDLIYASASFALGAGQEIESLIGTGPANLTLTGNALANTISGSSGSDTVAGGAGNDLLRGGAGADFFLFDTRFIGVTNVDTIVDFDWISDTIQLDHDVFGGLRIGQLSASAFAVDQATGSTAQIVYQSATGSLLYDSNGAGAGGATAFATVAPNLPSLNEAVFVVV